MKQKPRSEIRRISHILDDIKKEAWLGAARRWWPGYLFHFTDIRNALSILKEGALLSRNEARARGLMHTNNASPEIIGNTADVWKDYARLYFRPRTPTQYRNEGFRPPPDRHLNAHCPVPIYFIFDSKAVLSRRDVHFTEGSLATDPAPDILSGADGLEQIPFKRVYHDAAIPMSERSNIIFHRHAEVIIPRQLDLGALRYIVCRSQAERETFLHLLPQNSRMRWRDKIRIDSRKSVFFKRWTYVESADLSSSRMTLLFNETSETPGPFQADVYVTDTISREGFSWQNASFTANKPLNLTLASVGPLWDYSVRLSLDGQLAFADRYQEDDLPW